MIDYFGMWLNRCDRTGKTNYDQGKLESLKKKYKLSKCDNIYGESPSIDDYEDMDDWEKAQDNWVDSVESIQKKCPCYKEFHMQEKKVMAHFKKVGNASIGKSGEMYTNNGKDEQVKITYTVYDDEISESITNNELSSILFYASLESKLTCKYPRTYVPTSFSLWDYDDEYFSIKFNFYAKNAFGVEDELYEDYYIDRKTKELLTYSEKLDRLYDKSLTEE